MGLIPQTKCSRCDRKYSALRSRCPYCGAHRSKKGKRVSDTDNSTWKLIIGILLIVVLIAAVVVVLVTSLNDNPADKNKDKEKEKDKVEDVLPNGDDLEEGISTVEGNTPDDPTTPVADPDDPEDTPVDPNKVDSVKIYTAYGSSTTDFTVKALAKEQLTAKWTPEGVEATPEWKSSDESIFIVSPTGKVTALKVGTAKLTVTVNGVSAECVVRVN